MKSIELDGRAMTTIQRVHEEMVRVLDLPAYYGRNLDALWDILSTTQEEMRICLHYAPVMLNALEAYGAKLLGVFYDAAAERNNIEFFLAEEEYGD